MNKKVQKHGKTFHNFLLLVPLVLLFTGCTTAANPQRYYPEADNPPWVFTGSVHGTSGEIIISVDNTDVLQGKMPSFKEALRINGSYRDSSLIANCKMQYCSGGILCMVYVDRKPAVLLDFSGL